MHTPFGPAINLGTLDNPNYAGAAGGVAYMRGIHTALQVVKDLDMDSNWDPYRAQGHCAEAVEKLLTTPSEPGPNDLTVNVTIAERRKPE